MRMTAMTLLVVTLAAGCTPGGKSNWADVAGLHRPLAFRGQVTRTVGAKYLLYLPEGYGQKKTTWPLVLFLHGSGERGDDPEMVKRHGPPRLVAEGRQFPFILVSPQCPEDRRWDVDTLGALLDQLSATCDVDPDRVYVTGLSMGGFGTWAMAQRWPDRFAAIAPVCGGGDPEKARDIARLPIWVFHGVRDTVVPIASSEAMVMNLREYGSPVRFTAYPETGHDAWVQAYDTPELYTWLLAQRREPRPETPPEKVAPAGKPIDVEAESAKLSSVAVVELPGGGRGIRFDDELAVAKLTAQLPPGGYGVEVLFYCTSRQADAVYARADRYERSVWALELNKLSPANAMLRIMSRDKDQQVEIRLRTYKPGTVVDRVRFHPLY